MSALVNLLFVSGKFLTQAAAKTLQEVFFASLRGREYLELEYEKFGCVIEPHEHMLELIQDRSHELSELIGSEVDIHVAVIDNTVKDTLDTYFNSLSVPFIQVNKSENLTSIEGTQKNEKVLLTVNPKSNQTNPNHSKNAHVQNHQYSTKPNDKDLEFLKQQVRDKFKKLLRANSEKPQLNQKYFKKIDVSKTLQDMSDTQKYLLRDLNNLLTCLAQIEDLQKYMKLTGIKNNTIHVLLVKGNHKRNDVSKISDMRKEIKIKEIRCDSDPGKKLMEDNLFARNPPQNMGDSYGNYLIKKTWFGNNIKNNENTSKEITKILNNRKRKRDDDSSGDNELKFPTKNESRKHIKSNRSKRLTEELMNFRLNNYQCKDEKNDKTNDSDCRSESSPKKHKPNDENNSFYTFEISDLLPRFQELSKIDSNFQPQNEVSISHQLCPISFNTYRMGLKETVTKSAEKRIDMMSTTECKYETVILRKFKEKMRCLWRTSQFSPREDIFPEEKPIFLTKEHYRRLEKRMKKRMLMEEELRREQKFISISQSVFHKLNNYLTRMKRLEEHVLNEAKCIFMNKRHFKRLEKKIKYQILKEKEEEKQKQLMLLNQKIFEDLEKRLARKRILAQIQDDVQNTSQVIAENNTAFKKLQRRMLHNLVNNSEESNYVSPINALYGEEIVLFDKTAFNMLVDKMENYNFFNTFEDSSNRIKNQNTKILESNIGDTFENDDTDTDTVFRKKFRFFTGIDDFRISGLEDSNLNNDAMENLDEKVQFKEDTIEFEEDFIQFKNDYIPTEENNNDRDDVKTGDTEKIEKEVPMEETNQKTSEFLEVNEKVFNEFEKVQKTVKIIDKKTTFSASKSEDESGRLLLSPKKILNDSDKRNISTVQRLYNKNKNKTKIPYRCRSDTSTNLNIVNANTSNVPLCNNIFDEKEIVEATLDKNKLRFTDILEKTPTPKLDDVAKSTEYSNVKGKTEHDINKMQMIIPNATLVVKNVPVTKNLEDNIKETNNRLQQVTGDSVKHKSSKSGTRPQTGSKLEKTCIEITKCETVLDNYKKQEYKYQVIDRKKMLDDIVSRQKILQQNRQKAMIKQKQMIIQKNSVKKLNQTSLRNVGNASCLKSETLKQNKLINKNPKVVNIDRNLERKLVQKDIHARASKAGREKERVSLYKPTEDKTKPISKYRVIFEQKNTTEGKVGKDTRTSTHRYKKKDSNAILYPNMNENSESFIPSSKKKNLNIKGTKNSINNRNAYVYSKKELHSQPSKIEGSVRVTNLYQKKKIGKNRNKDLEIKGITETASGLQDVFLEDQDSEYHETEDQSDISESVHYDLKKTLRLKSKGLDRTNDREERIRANVDDIIETIYTCDAVSGISLSMEELDKACDSRNESITECEDEEPPELITSENCRGKRSPDQNEIKLPKKCKSVEEESLNLDMELMDEKDIILLLSKFAASENNIESHAKQIENDYEKSIAELHEPRSEIVSKKFDRKPWGTNVINQTPSQMKKIMEPDILPQTTIWNNHPRQKVALPPKQKNKSKEEKKYKYHTKEIVMGNKVTRVTYLVEE